MQQYNRLAEQGTRALQLVQRTISAAGIESRVLKRHIMDTAAKVVRPLYDGSLEGLGVTLTLEICDW